MDVLLIFPFFSGVLAQEHMQQKTNLHANTQLKIGILIFKDLNTRAEIWIF